MSLLLLPAWAVRRVHYDSQHLDMIIQGQVDAFVASVEGRKSFSWEKDKITLDEGDSVLYGISLITMGEVLKADKFIRNAIVKHPKTQELKDLKKHIDFYHLIFLDEGLNFTKEEKAQIKIMEEFPRYLNARVTNHALNNSEANSIPEMLKWRKQILSLIDDTDNCSMYFPAKLEYLIEFRDSALDAKAKAEAQKILVESQRVLFPKTPDFYELAVAYRVLGILEHRYREDRLSEQKSPQALKYFKMSEYYVAKMRSLWLEEDTIVDKKIMKTRDRQTQFGYVLPQYLIGLKERFSRY